MVITLLTVTCIAANPWWDDYLTTAQTDDAELAAELRVDSALCGVMDDPGWGILGAMIRYDGMTDARDDLQTAGIRMLSYTETFGEALSYIAEFAPNADGQFDVLKPRRNGWAFGAWQPQDGSMVEWVGLPAYYDQEAWCAPWDRSHPRFGAPPFTYPDGRPASGWINRELGPLGHAIFDAGASKDVLGEVACGFVDGPEPITAPLPGFLPYDSPDGTAYSGIVHIPKDFACPHWAEYAKASTRLMAESGVDGVWSDNFSAWDGLGSQPITNAFGEWTVASFRDYLAAHHAPEELAALGVDDINVFDIRTYLRDVLRETLSGDDTNLRDPLWRDPSWLEDPLWSEFLDYKVEAGTRALQAYHDAVIEGARLGGRDDFLIQGNDIPMWSFGMARPESLEMVSTEFSPGWSLMGGSRGVGLPPRGRLAPFIKAARCHAQSRFVQIWYYLDGEYERYRGDAALGRVLEYEMLANHAMVQSYPGLSRVAGADEEHIEVNEFIRRARTIWGDRVPWARIALVLSPTSQLAELAPGGLVDFNGQRHAFHFLGWGTALAELHQQYDVLPEWRLTAADLTAYEAVILPSVVALNDSVIDDVLSPWVRDGGTLVISGPTALRHGENMSPSLARLLSECAPPGADGVRALGAGGVLVSAAIGYEYYNLPFGTRDLGAFSSALEAMPEDAGLVSGELPRDIEVSVFRSRDQGTVFVDIANLGIDLQAPIRPDTRQVTIHLALRDYAPTSVPAIALQPNRENAVVAARSEDGGVELGPIAIGDYASIIVPVAR